MCTKSLKKWALLLTFWVALQLSPLRAQTIITGNEVSGNLTVTGTTDLQSTLDIQGVSLTLGTNSSTTNPGAGMFYTDGTTSTLEFDATRSANIWKWQQNGGAALQLQMKLDNNNTLTLWDQSSPTQNANIVLNPLGSSTFANSVTVNGTDNEMPHQTLVNADSVLTEGLADSRYLLASGWDSTASGNFSTAMGWRTAAGGNYSTAMGVESTASGIASTAMGIGSSASGNYSTAMGGSFAPGNYSTAMGFDSYASGNYSTAMGRSSASGYNSTAMGRSSASGYYSTAMGFDSYASGNYSTASGFYTQAQAYDSFVIGAYNLGLSSTGASPSGGTWVPTDPLFEIGNGGGPVPGYIDYNNEYWTWNPPANGTIVEVIQVGSNSSYSSYYCVAPWVPASAGTSDALVVYKDGSAKFSGPVQVPQSGDIPMYTGN